MIKWTYARKAEKDAEVKKLPPAIPIEKGDDHIVYAGAPRQPEYIKHVVDYMNDSDKPFAWSELVLTSMDGNLKNKYDDRPHSNVGQQKN